MTNHRDTNHAHRRIGRRLGHVLREVLAGLDALNRIQHHRPWERMKHRAGQRADGRAS